MNRLGKAYLTTAVTLVASASLLAGCGGGGSSLPNQSPAAAPTAAPQLPTATIVFTFPYGPNGTANQRSPQYISPNTTKFVTTLNTVNGGTPPGGSAITSTTTLDFTPGTGNCTLSGGTATCTVKIPAPPGTDNYTFNAENNANTVLSTVTQDIVMAVGTNNTPSVVLQGVVKTVTISSPTVSADPATIPVNGQALTVTALDPSGATIVGSASFAHPVTITDSDATGQTALHVNGGPASLAVQFTKPGDAITFDYTGQATNNLSLTPSGTGVTGTATNVTATVFDVTFVGTALDDAAHGGSNTDLNWGQDTLSFAQPSGSQNVQARERGWNSSTNAHTWSGKYTLDPGDGTNHTCGTSGTIASIDAATPGTTPSTLFTIDAKGAGVCSMRFKESGTGYPLTNHAANASGSPTHDGTFWISVTSGSVTVNGRHN